MKYFWVNVMSRHANIFVRTCCTKLNLGFKCFFNKDNKITNNKCNFLKQNDLLQKNEIPKTKSDNTQPCSKMIPSCATRPLLMFCCIWIDYIYLWPNWLIPLFFSSDAHCAAGELEMYLSTVGLRVWVQSSCSLQYKLDNLWTGLTLPPARVCAYPVGHLSRSYSLLVILGDWGESQSSQSFFP